MKHLLFGLSLLAVVAATPLSLTYCAAWAVRDRLRTRNRVMVYLREVGTPRVTLISFVPRQSSRWGRA